MHGLINGVSRLDASEGCVIHERGRAQLVAIAVLEGDSAVHALQRGLVAGGDVGNHSLEGPWRSVGCLVHGEHSISVQLGVQVDLQGAGQLGIDEVVKRSLQEQRCSCLQMENVGSCAFTRRSPASASQPEVSSYHTRQYMAGMRRRQLR